MGLYISNFCRKGDRFFRVPICCSAHAAPSGKYKKKKKKKKRTYSKRKEFTLKGCEFFREAGVVGAGRELLGRGGSVVTATRFTIPPFYYPFS